MLDPTGVFQTVGAVVAAVAGSAAINWWSKRAARDQTRAETSAAKVTADANTQIARNTAEADFRKDILARVASLEKQVDDAHRRLEAQRVNADAKFEAREDQLIQWGTWDKDEPPRRAPAFVWPPRATP